MDKNKIIIIGIVIVIIALIAGIAIALTGNNNGSNGVSEASEGRDIYNFDSVFTMEVPENTTFLKTWLDANESGIITEGDVADFFSKNKEFEVYYIDSHMLNDARVDYILAVDDGNITTEQDGDLIIIHDPTSSGKVGKTWETTEFKEAVAIHKGTKLVLIEGNDPDFIKSMANTIKFRE